jgi:hypothetical protein
MTRFIRHKNPYAGTSHEHLGKVLTRIMQEHFDDTKMETEEEANDFEVDDVFDTLDFGLTDYELKPMIEESLQLPQDDMAPNGDEDMGPSVVRHKKGPSMSKDVQENEEDEPED